MPNYSTDYTMSEFLSVCAAREIKDGETVFAGVGLPLMGALLAQNTHAPNSILAMECGGIGPKPKRIFLGIGDNTCVENAIFSTSLWRLFSDQQKGFFDVGMIGGAQIDKYGNLNSTVIIGDKDYYTPVSRLPGSGGANDIASSALRTIVTMPLQKRRFVEKVDYITSPGHIDRKRYGLPGGGPSAVITDKCILRFDEETGEAYLASLTAGVTVDEVRAGVSWDLKVPDKIEETEPPTVEQIELLRFLDANKIYTGNGLASMTFESYIEMLINSYERMG